MNKLFQSDKSLRNILLVIILFCLSCSIISETKCYKLGTHIYKLSSDTLFISTDVDTIKSFFLNENSKLDSTMNYFFIQLWSLCTEEK